jgi:LAO/AO transport system kinase
VPLTATPDLTLVDRMLGGDRVALAKLMTRVENEAGDVAAVMARIYSRVGNADTIGVTGPPGAGKSTLVDRLLGKLRAAGRSVGVIAVDPSSPFSGGAVLGDRIRMQNHALDPAVFIRSLSTRGRRGGLARATRQIAHLLDAFGKERIIIETVGVGQTELDIMELARTVVVVLVPEAGDTVQVMKAGLLEIAHVFVVNKADREGAMRMKTELQTMLQLRPSAGWEVPVLLTEAQQDRGVDELMAAIDAHRDYREHHGDTRVAEEHREREFLDVLDGELRNRLERRVGSAAADLLARVRRGEVDPYTATLELLRDRDAVRHLLGDR